MARLSDSHTGDKHTPSPATKVMGTFRSTNSHIDDERKMATSCMMGRGHNWACGSLACLPHLGGTDLIVFKVSVIQTSV